MSELWSPKDPLETIVGTLDFTGALAGEVATACVVDIFRTDGAVEDTTTMVVGASDISAKPVMKQKISGGTSGEEYMVRFKVTTATRVITGSARMLCKAGA